MKNGVPKDHLVIIKNHVEYDKWVDAHIYPS